MPTGTERLLREKVDVRLLGTVADFGKERVFILTEGDIADMLNGMDKDHILNCALVEFLELMRREMFLK